VNKLTARAGDGHQPRMASPKNAKREAKVFIVD
jgi:hypothetical protein